MRALVAGNWKMHRDHVEAIHLTQQLGVLLRAHDHEGVDVMVLPPFTDLRSVTSVVAADRLELGVGAQHVSHRDPGPYTGEVSVAMLHRLGVTAVLVGHSERRELFHMGDETVAATLRAARTGGLTPILCVGEPAGVRAAGDHADFVAGQLRAALAGAPEGPLVVAYEPVWAIGAGASATGTQVREMASVVRDALPRATRDTTRVLYGGSVAPDNAGELMGVGEVDGFLVGGASLLAEQFVAIVVAAHDCYASSR